ncbi:helix-turn-helix domain-containing protein [Streptomyces sp. NPDC008141]|uniref:helix-turn-helix domain-containing protein n=1 Tax=Streptomyces sp. NPDC008141 TaxID=3364815 RepID=UPI0036EDB179
MFQYFECGGNHDTAAAVLAIHRSTLRYRLQRIRKIGGVDLADVDSRRNLHSCRGSRALRRKQPRHHAAPPSAQWASGCRHGWPGGLRALGHWGLRHCSQSGALDQAVREPRTGRKSSGRVERRHT